MTLKCIMGPASAVGRGPWSSEMQSKCLDVHHSVSLEVGHVILREYYNIKEKARGQEWSLLWKFQRAL